MEGGETKTLRETYKENTSSSKPESEFTISPTINRSSRFRFHCLSALSLLNLKKKWNWKSVETLHMMLIRDFSNSAVFIGC